MEQFVYIFLYVIVEAMIIWILEWRERGWEETRSISWVQRKVIKLKKRRRRRLRKSKRLARQRVLLVSYLRFLQKVKLDEATPEGSLASEDGSNHVLISRQDGIRKDDDQSSYPQVSTTQCSTPKKGVKVTTSETFMPPKDLDALKSDSVKTDIRASDVTQYEPVARELKNKDPITDDVKALMEDILFIVCSKTTTEDETTAEEEMKKIKADQTVAVNKSQPNVINHEPITRPFLFDCELAAENSVSNPPGPRELVPFTDFDDVIVEDDVLTGKDGYFWDVEDMFEYNRIHFEYESSLDHDLSEYTTPLIREDTEEYQLRWERACRLEQEINTKKLADQAAQGSKKRRKKKAKKAKITDSSAN